MTMALSAVFLNAKPKVDPLLWSEITAPEAQSTTVVVTLKDPYDLTKLPQNISDPLERGKKIAALLEEHTKRTVSHSLPFLIVTPTSGVEEVTPLWISHAVRVKATPEIIKKLTQWSDIDSIHLETKKEIAEIQDSGAATLAEPPTNERKLGWGLEKLKAPELWKGEFEGTKIDGSGVLVAMIDSGIALTHPDLAENIYTNPKETGVDQDGKDKAKNGVDDDGNGLIDDVHGWNFENKTNDPTDTQGHGTQTAGIVAGNGTNGTQTGVAPKATLLPIRACCTLDSKAGETVIMESMQYAIKMGARVISMSLSIKPFSNPNYALWRRASETTLAAGVIHVNSAGNLGKGKEPSNIGAPASNPPAWFHEKQVHGDKPSSMITVGATDENDKLRFYSGVGPVTWENVPEYKDFPYEKGKKPGLIRPDVCGPSEVPSTSFDGKSYIDSFKGTSSATPHIGGVVALLVQAKPNLTPAEAVEALQMSAVPIDSTGFGNHCGAGRVDALAAVSYLRTHFKRP